MPPRCLDDTLSLAELRAAADARDAPTTARQVKRLREEGLLRCVGQQHPKGSRGSSSRYAASEVDQLVLVHELGRRERRFDERRILVAWHGGWVEPEDLRDSLVRILDAVSATVGRVTEGIDDPAEAADRLTRADRGKRKPSEAVQLMRDRLDGDGRALQSAMYALASMGVGADIEWEDHDPESKEESLESITARAIGIDKARSDEVVPGKTLMSPTTSAKEVLEGLQVTGLLEMQDLAGAFREASHEAILQAFEDGRLVSGMDLFAQAAEASHGGDVGGLGSVRTLQYERMDAVEVAGVVRGSLLMRPSVPDGRFEATAAALEQASGPMQVMLEMRRALPAYAELLGVDTEARLAALPEQEAEQVRSDIRAWLESRPDMRALLAPKTDDAPAVRE
jgi:hypothetical protein